VSHWCRYEETFGKFSINNHFDAFVQLGHECLFYIGISEDVVIHMVW
jgi:hypothetical protein